MLIEQTLHILDTITRVRELLIANPILAGLELDQLKRELEAEVQDYETFLTKHIQAQILTVPDNEDVPL